jgi:hypothetical protein
MGLNNPVPLYEPTATEGQSSVVIALNRNVDDIKTTEIAHRLVEPQPAAALRPVRQAGGQLPARTCSLT